MTRLTFARPVSAVQAASNVRAASNVQASSKVQAGSNVRAVAGVASIQLHDDLWRITRTDGEVLGYVEHAATQAGSRFTAKRMVQRQRRFLPIGEFWSMDDALECFKV